MYRNTPLLYRVVESFFRYRNLFAIAAIIVTVIPGAVLVTRKPSYTSTAMIQVIDDVSYIIGDNSRNYSWIPVSQQNVTKFNDWMGDDSQGGFVDLALQKANLSHPINVDPRARDPRLVQLRKGLNFNTSSDTVFNINLVWDNPTECEQIVKAFQEQYIERIGEEKQLQAHNIADFLETEKQKYGARLKIAEDSVSKFKTDNSASSGDAHAAMMDQLSNLRNQLNDMMVSSQTYEIQRKGYEEQILHMKPTRLKEMTEKEAPPQEDPLVTRKKQLEAQRDDLLLKGWLKTSTRVQALETQISGTQTEIDAQAKANPNPVKQVQKERVYEDNPAYQEVQTLLKEATIHGESDKAQIAQLQQRIGEYETRLARLPQAERDLNDRVRDADIIKTQYNDVAKRLEDARLKASLDKKSATATLRSIGTVYAQSTGGKAKTAMMLGGLLVFGLILGIGVTLLAEWADPSVRYASDVQRRLGVPVLISLPEMAPLMMVTASPSDTDHAGGRPLLPARDE